MYIRYDKDCKKATQPGKVARSDIFGNTFENWCADYVPHDAENNVAAVTTFKCVDYKTVNWKHMDVDNKERDIYPYEKNVSVFDLFVPTIGRDLLVDEDDIGIEITSNGQQFALFSEDGYLVRFEDNTDVVLTSATTVSTEFGDTVQTNDGYDVSIE